MKYGWLIGLVVIAIIGIAIWLLAAPTPTTTETTTTSGTSSSTGGLLDYLNPIKDLFSTPKTT